MTLSSQKNRYSCSMVFRVNSIVGQNASGAHDNYDAEVRALVCQISALSQESDIPQCFFWIGDAIMNFDVLFEFVQTVCRV